MSEAPSTTQPRTTTTDDHGAQSATSLHNSSIGGRESDQRSSKPDQPGTLGSVKTAKSDKSLKKSTSVEEKISTPSTSTAFQSIGNRSSRMSAKEPQEPQPPSTGSHDPRGTGTISPGNPLDESDNQTDDGTGIYTPRSNKGSPLQDYGKGLTDALSEDELDLDILDNVSVLEMADKEFWDKQNIRSSADTKNKFSSFAHKRTVLGFKNDGIRVSEESDKFVSAYIYNLQMLVDYNKEHGFKSKSPRSPNASERSSRSKTPPVPPPKNSKPENKRPPPLTGQEQEGESHPKTPTEERKPASKDTDAVSEEEERIRAKQIREEKASKRRESFMRILERSHQVKSDQQPSGIAVPEPPKLTKAQKYALARKELVQLQKEGEAIDEYATRIKKAERTIINWHGVSVPTQLLDGWNPEGETEDEYHSRLKVHALLVDAYFKLNESIQASTHTSRAANSARAKEESEPPASVRFAHQADDKPSVYKDKGGRIRMKEDLASRIALQKIRNSELNEKGYTRYDDQGIRFEGPNRTPVDAALREFAERTATKPTRDSSKQPSGSAAAASGHPGGDDDDSSSDSSNSSSEEQSDPPRNPNEGNGGGGGGRRPSSEPPPRGGSAPPSRIHRSLSTPGQNGIRGRTPGLTEVDEQYHDNMVSRLLQIIRQHLTVRLRIPEGTKLRRMDGKTVGLYEGGRTYDELEKWLYDLVIYLQSSQYGGPDRDDECVLAINEFLGKEPKNWYRTNIQSVQREQLHWTFEQVIIGLYERFVHASSMQDARLAFYNEKYTAAEGVQRFYDALIMHARNMSVFPDAYTLMTKFVSELPEDMVDTLIKEGLSPEKHTIDDFLRESIALESADLVRSLFKKSRKLLVPGSSSTPAAKATQSKDKGKQREIRLPVVGKAYLSKAQAVNADGTPRIFIQTKRSKPRLNNRTGNNKPNRRPENKAQMRPEPKKPTGNRNCFTCGKEGHFSADCPEGKPKAFIRAAHTAAPEEGAADDERSEENPQKEPDKTSDESESNETSEGSLASVEVYGTAFYEENAYSDDDRLHAMCDYDPNGSEIIVDYEPTDDELSNNIKMSETIRSIREETIADTGVDDKGEPMEQKVTFRKVHLRASKQARARPEFGPELKECLASFITVGNCEAWTLWDSGSTTTGLTPAFADVARIKVFPLLSPIVLQLGTIGSRATVNYGSEPTISLPGFKGSTYMDVANFDRYDMIIGTPFMRMNKVHLDFETNTVTVNGVSSPATRVLLADTDARARRYRTVEKMKQVE